MQLLNTKFHIPGFNGDTAIPRKRISRLIGDNCSIVIISAPAGFGKTTLLSEWVGNCKTQVAWVSLEKSEDVPGVFWSYLITAVSSVLSGCGRNALEQIKSSGISSIENILIGLINEIEEHGVGFTLVMDDYHVITDGLIRTGIEFLIDHLPSNMRIIISGREDPRLSLSKFRLSGKLAEIRAGQFRFSADEAEALLNKVHGLDLNKEDIVSLRDKTEGWIAGLALAILSIREQKDRRSFINDFTGSHRYIIDYLVEEVLSGLGADVREFMLKIAILERFCPGLCGAVTENPESSGILMDMEQNNLFLIPLDNHREWFRYHHLFREFLLKNLMETHAGEVQGLHGKAFYWLKDRGYGTEAFNHGVPAEKYGEAAELLADNAPGLFRESGGYMLKRLIDRLPEEIVRNHPELCCYTVWLDVLAGDFNSVDLLLQDSFKGNETVAGFISLIKGYRYFYQTGEFGKSINEIKVCLRLLPEKVGFARDMGELVLGLSLLYSGDIRSAYEYIERISLDDDIPVLRAICYADVLFVMGKLGKALSFIDRTIENGIRMYGENLISEYGFLYILKGDILRERNDIGGALKACRRGLYLARNNEYIEVIFLGNMVYARVLAADDNYGEAERAMAVSIEAVRGSSKWAEFMSRAHEVRMELARGNGGRAEELLTGMVDFSATRVPYYESLQYLSFCRYCLLKQDFQRVHGITDAMIREDIPVKREGRLIECYVLKALACHAEQDMDRALEILGRAFAISEKEGQVRVYIDEGDGIRALFGEALKRGLLPEYLKKYADGGETGPGDTRSVIINEFKENFNGREIDILKLMKKGCSNKIIADTLFLSVNTVRWYASRIFAKLNVKRRGEAVAVADKYELI
ncbi:MAG: hypothetical protein GY737_25250 [Desulfobacteraceae bacterium]|nr:hypothetical protein [Desulfobacteraceae bacterium]